MNQDLEADFAVLDTEWQSIVANSATTRDILTQWDADMARLAGEHDQLLHSGRWVVGAEDILSIIGRPRFEAYHSAMLAWLLNPLGKHGLGTTFLELLAKRCGLNNDLPNLHLARPQVEVHRVDTRADIVVFAPSVTLVIENKVDAKEQERQCDRLVERFGRHPRAVFLFLSPSGNAPITATGANRDVWTALRYRELAGLLETALCTTATNPDSGGRSTAQNYLLTIQREFS